MPSAAVGPWGQGLRLCAGLPRQGVAGSDICRLPNGHGVRVTMPGPQAGTSLEWVRFWCLARSEALEKALLQPSCSHTYGFSPVWERR